MYGSHVKIAQMRAQQYAEALPVAGKDGIIVLELVIGMYLRCIYI